MEKTHLTPEMILSELSLIEKHLCRTTMTFYTPTNLMLGDVINIQKEASQMMKFVGLNGYTPVITFIATDESEAGNIHLDNSKDVFIQIGEKYRSNNAQILAIMAHEICHKVLYVHGLYYPNISIKNEILTDLATVYVGFGKLSLNGTFQRYTTKQYNWNYRGEKEEVTVEHTENIGYISSRSFALAYCFVCNRFNINKNYLYQGLNSHATSELASITPFFGAPVTMSNLNNSLRYVQEVEASTFNSIIVLEEIIRQVRKKLNQKHESLFNDYIQPFDNPDEILTSKQFAAQSVILKHREESNEFINISNTLSDIAKIACEREKNEIDEDALKRTLLNIECPRCGFLNSTFLKENKFIFVRCPKCKHVFLWDGSLHLREPDIISEDMETDNSSKSFFSRIFKKHK